MDKDQAVREFFDAIRPAVLRLFEGAEESARSRLISLLQGEVAPNPKPPARTAPSDSLGYGALTKRIRDALVQVTAGRSDGADAEAVHALCPDLTILQVRSGLKTLRKTGDALRVSRGNYLPASGSAKAETGGVRPPESQVTSSQSAEAASNGPKGNGAP